MAKRRGRPPAGRKGEPRTAMRHQISARISDDTYAQLRALSAVLQVSQAEVIARGFDALESALAPTEQRLVALLKQRQGSRSDS